jgi:uncharacterized protein (TIRG00374 family)
LKRTLINTAKFLVFLGTGVGILFLVYRHQNEAYQQDCLQKGVAAADCSLVVKVANDFASANVYWLLAICAAFIISNISRAIRWNMLLQQLGHQPRLINGFLTIVLGYFANMGLPRLGEIVRAGSMASYERIPVDKVIGTVVVDRMIDVVSLLLITSLAVFLEFDRIETFATQYVDLSKGGTLAVFAVIGLLGMVLLYVFRKPLQRSAVYTKIAGAAQGFVEGLRTVARLDKPGLFVLHSINVWAMYFLMVYWCFFSFGPTAGLSATAALIVFVFGSWGIVIPSPGGMGTYHFLAQVALGMYGVSGSDGFSFANISFFTIQLGCNILIGLLALVLLPLINGRPKEVINDAA